MLTLMLGDGSARVGIGVGPLLNCQHGITD